MKAQATLKVATVNVRRFASGARFDEFISSLDGLRCDVVGVSETKRKGLACTAIQSTPWIYYNANDQNPARGDVGGTGFFVHKSYLSAVKQFVSVSRRVSFLDIVIGVITVRLVQVYAPTSSSSDNDYDELLAQLGDILDNKHPSAKKSAPIRVIILGDFNAKLGKKEPGDTVIGPHGYGTRNGRGDTLINFCTHFGLRAVDTFFPIPLSKKWTWRSPDGSTKNKIDYVLVLDRHMNAVKNVVAYRYINYSTDHRLLKIRIKVPPIVMKRYRPRNPRCWTKTSTSYCCLRCQ